MKAERSTEDGVRSIETGAVLLRQLMHAAGPVRLKELAASSRLSAPKAHRYLRSYIRTGLVVQDARTRCYDLGPLAFSMGALALQRHAIWAAGENLSRLREATGTAVSLVVWGASGPIVVRTEESPERAGVVIPTGEMPVTTSAAGRIFAALLPERMTRGLVNAELPAGSAAAFAQVLAEARVRRITRVIDGFIPGNSALSAPIMDTDGHVAAAVCVLGGASELDTSWNGRPALELQRFVKTVGATSDPYSAMR